MKRHQLLLVIVGFIVFILLLFNFSIIIPLPFANKTSTDLINFNQIPHHLINSTKDLEAIFKARKQRLEKYCKHLKNETFPNDRTRSNFFIDDDLNIIYCW